MTAIVVYDGDCGFCTWTATRGQRLLPAEVTIQPWQHTDLAALGLDQDSVRCAVQWVAPGHPPRAGHRAIASWLIASALPWSIPGALLLIPPVSWIAAASYLVIARHRHQIPGPWRRGGMACAVTTGRADRPS
jgi:predicted DCC family thiol-disulfide oxidoreductase YuxK